MSIISITFVFFLAGSASMGPNFVLVRPLIAPRLSVNSTIGDVTMVALEEGSSSPADINPSRITEVRRQVVVHDLGGLAAGACLRLRVIDDLYMHAYARR